MSYNTEKQYLIALNHFPKFGEKRLKLLKNYFSSWENAYKAKINQYIEAKIPENVANEFIAFRNNLDISQVISVLEKENIKIIELEKEDYPSLLSEIYDPPRLLFCKGDTSILKNKCIGIVGSRKCTPYGMQATSKLVKELCGNDFSIVSGLAMGIDAHAHKNCNDIGGKTIAVLGTGIDSASIYPSQNRYLAKEILDKDGLIISEFSVGTPPLRHHFPMRNRIISGLSLGIIVIEAVEKSGAIITAQTAIDQNRDVFAVPGSIFSDSSKGTNKLIKQGARLVENSQDILDALDINQLSSYISIEKLEAKSPDEEKIIPHLSHDPIHIDELKRLSGLDSASLSSAITMMELRGAIKDFGGKKYAIK